jgi:tRNA-specific 2-thiouridylase
MHDEGVIAVGMSGGVDSSVAAHLLTAAGYRVVGVSHYLWEFSSCCEEEAMSRAAEVCRRLGIPYYRIDLYGEFERQVIDDFTAAYLRGETPNPCVRCNETIRFGLFPGRVKSRLVEAGEMEPYEQLLMATGHYARILHTGGEAQLLKGLDPSKEQSYMLYRLSREILPRCRFPLGEYRKSEVIRIAERESLPTASIRESQDICFVDGSYTDFIRQRTDIGTLERTGPIYDLSGRRLGEHRGYIHYTIGQRQGLGLSNGPWYVAEIDAEHNAVTVARREELGTASALLGEENWLTELPERFEGRVRLRYNSAEVPAEVQRLDRGGTRILFEKPQVVTPGQSAVVYDGERVLGGGILRKEG